MKNIIYILLALVMVSFGCSRTVESSGPDICPTEKFDITGLLLVKAVSDNSATQVNLLDDYANISAAFNEVVSWRVVVTGTVSGAVTSYAGKSNAVNLSWYGQPTGSVFFKQGELVTFNLYVSCTTEPKNSAQITITTNAGLSQFGHVLTNFEDTNPYGGVYSKYPLNPAVQTLFTPSTGGYNGSPQGENYLRFACTANPDSLTWYFGGFGFNAPFVEALAGTLPANPNDVYINVLTRGSANSQAQFILQEELLGNNLKRKFLVTVGSEWTLSSARLSDIGIIDPTQIKLFDVNLGAATAKANNASVEIDLIIFTEGKPLGQ